MQSRESSLAGLTSRSRRHGGFTLAEMVIVAAVLGIIAYMVIPSMSRATTYSSSHLTRAADLVQADIQYCQSACVNDPNDLREMVFSVPNDNYFIASASDPTAPIINRGTGQPYLQALNGTGNPAFDQVTLTNVSGTTGGVLAFNQYGIPTTNGSNAMVTLSCNGEIISLTVSGTTGEVTVGLVQPAQ